MDARSFSITSSLAMTRNEAKQLKQVMQQSAAESMASENSTTSIYVTSSEAWLNRESNASQADTRRRLGSGTLGLDLLTGNTSIGTPSVQRGGIKGRGEKIVTRKKRRLDRSLSDCYFTLQRY